MNEIIDLAIFYGLCLLMGLGVVYVALGLTNRDIFSVIIGVLFIFPFFSCVILTWE